MKRQRRLLVRALLLEAAGVTIVAAAFLAAALFLGLDPSPHP